MPGRRRKIPFSYFPNADNAHGPRKSSATSTVRLRRPAAASQSPSRFAIGERAKKIRDSIADAATKTETVCNAMKKGGPMGPVITRQSKNFRRWNGYLINEGEKQGCQDFG